MTSAKIIDGKAIAEAIANDVAKQSAVFLDKTGVKPGLAVILVGEDPASAVYVRNKNKRAATLGFQSTQHTLAADTSQSTLEGLIDQLNQDSQVHGILLQLPLPAHLDATALLERIAPEKDVDGFHPVNVGRLSTGKKASALVPCTPAGCLELAKHAHGAPLAGLNVVVVGRSNIVGKPAAQLFLDEDCTVTIAHSKTKNIEALARQADVLIAAAGRPEMITADWIKPGAIVLDVGINRIEGEGRARLVGDVAFEDAARVAGAITPVPGGVGPMTIAMLMKNTLTAAQRLTPQ